MAPPSPLLLIGLVLMVALPSVLGANIGIGWVLNQLAAFSLFVGSFVGLFAVTISALAVSRLFAGLRRVGDTRDGGADRPPVSEESDDFDAIPVTRFVRDRTDYTWENWTRFNLANSVYIEFQDDARPVSALNKEQQRELAVRLADVAIAILKAKPATTRRLNVTTAQYRKHLSQMGQHPYDDDILAIAVDAVNEGLQIGQPHYLNVVTQRTWGQLAL